MFVTVQVTEIEFDFTQTFPVFSDDVLNEQEQFELTEMIHGEVYEVEVENDNDDEIKDALMQEISCITGWCINHLNFRHVLK